MKEAIHSETTRYAALPSAPQPFGCEANACPPGSEPWSGEYLGSNRPAEGHARNTQDRTSENGACAAWRASTASWPDAETCEARVGEERTKPVSGRRDNTPGSIYLATDCAARHLVNAPNSIDSAHIERSDCTPLHAPRLPIANDFH